MRTYDILLLLASSLGILFVLLMPLAWGWFFSLITVMVVVTAWQWSTYTVRSILLRDDCTLFIKEGGTEYAAVILPASVMTRYLGFLHASGIDISRSWYIPVSRLEFSAAAFKQLKRSIHVF